MKQKKIFVCVWTFIGWRDLSLGFHICLGELYLDLHLPFGWLRIGWEDFPKHLILNLKQAKARQHGLTRHRFKDDSQPL